MQKFNAFRSVFSLPVRPHTHLTGEPVEKRMTHYVLITNCLLEITLTHIYVLVNIHYSKYDSKQEVIMVIKM